jgi:hypothetical protein
MLIPSGLRLIRRYLARWTMGSLWIQRSSYPILEYGLWTSSIHVARTQEFSHFDRSSEEWGAFGKW